MNCSVETFEEVNEIRDSCVGWDGREQDGAGFVAESGHDEGERL